MHWCCQQVQLSRDMPIGILCTSDIVRFFSTVSPCMYQLLCCAKLVMDWWARTKQRTPQENDWPAPGHAGGSGCCVLNAVAYCIHFLRGRSMQHTQLLCLRMLSGAIQTQQRCTCKTQLMHRADEHGSQRWQRTTTTSQLASAPVLGRQLLRYANNIRHSISRHV